jgi:hypothetical protein
MNRNPKQSLWVLALGIAFTGFSATSRAAAVPAQQNQDQERSQYQERKDNQVYFQQGVQDGQHDRQFGGNRSEHPQPNDASDLRAYRNGYKQGFHNTASEPKAPGRVRRIWWTRRT